MNLEPNNRSLSFAEFLDAAIRDKAEAKPFPYTFKKVYVTMIVKITKDGSLRPLSMVWEDGANYEIDRVLHITPAASLKVGGCGTRYTVMIEGKQRDLYDEDGKWFVEKEVPA